MRATSIRHAVDRDRPATTTLPAAGATRSSETQSGGLVGRDDLVWKVRVVLAETRRPVCLAGPTGSGSAALACTVAEALAQQKRVFGIVCTPDLTFVRLAETLAEGLAAHDLCGGAAIVLTDAGAATEPGFVRAVAHLARSMPAIGWLIAGAPRGAVSDAHTLDIPLLSEADTALAVEAALARRGAAMSRIARRSAAALVRGLPGFADRLVAGACEAASAEDCDIGLPHLRAAARALAGRDVSAEASPFQRAAARTTVDPDGSFPRAAVAVALERGGDAGRSSAKERDRALVPAGRGRLRFADDAAAARLLLSEFGWTLPPG